MAYEPTEWKSGDVVTSAKLNKIEQGIASGGVLVATDTEGTLDKTWQEIHDAALAVVKKGNLTGIVMVIAEEVDVYPLMVLFLGDDGHTKPEDYIAESANGYPVLD